MLPTDPDDPVVLQDRSLLRLQQLSDGIFALAMTLMVLQFEFPNPLQFASDPEIGKFLLAQLPALSIYFGSFLLLAFYWIARVEQFKYCQRTDGVHLWLNLLSLMFAIVVPYTNGLSTLYETIPSVQLLYSGTLFLVGLFSWLSWLYASQDGRLTGEELSPAMGRLIAVESAIEPVVCLLAIAMTFIAPVLWSVTFLAVLPGYLLLSGWKQKVAVGAATPMPATSEEVGS